MFENSSAGEKLLSIKDVCALVSVAHSSIYDFINVRSSRHRPDFPRPVRFNLAGRGAVRWRHSEVETWMAMLPRG